MKRIWLLVLLQAFIAGAYADDSSNVQQGAADYNWDTCVGNKTNDCINSCVNSEDINCQSTCTQLARDKCQNEGLSAPQSNPNNDVTDSGPDPN
ncbi:MAG TPA: hypothetical protein VL360_02495 [Gammaproteobacteria bacterium]|jgi:hypothetical protein|nr:hypothetical protein [Gammaproteobacteria bacterium]